jgi:hypothetical protein
MRLTLGIAVVVAALSAGFAVAQISPRLPQNLRVPSEVVHRAIPPLLPQPHAPCGHADCDGDGHAGYADRGDDCDDFDANRYPGNAERPDTRDDDCDASTFGFLDEDHDGAISQAIYNVAANGQRYGGDDCDDHQAGIRPTAQELPNHIDDNCDGLVDNLLGTWYTPAPPQPTRN